MNAYQIRPYGLGIIITELCFLLATGRRPVTAVVSNKDNLVFDLKRIFQIPDSVLTIEFGQHGWPDLETDELCTYAPYFRSDHIDVFGQVYSTKRKKKRCVALAMHHNSGLVGKDGYQGMPYNKFATLEQYEKIFSQLTEHGYDVITMNQTQMTLEQKTYLLNEACDFVIGYEGGLGHLAHLLGIPYFCLPWRFNDMGHGGEQPGLYYEPHRFHADRRTWFLHSTDEFLGWSKDRLHAMIDQLYADGGNNILFEPDTVIDPATYNITAGNGMDLTPRIMWCQTRGARTAAFIREHLPFENMQKYRVKSSTYTP